MKYAGKKVHFIGIGGISMCGLAEIMLHNGCTVSGSDRTDSAIIARLRTLGITVFIGHDAAYQSDADIIVYTSAIAEDNPELVAARAAGKPVIARADLLGEIMHAYDISIGVSGMHGKTTASSMISTALYHCNKNPTVNIGGILPIFGSASHIGGKDFFVLEACEYKDNFLSFKPDIAIILNIEADHLDYFRDLEHIIESFSRYIAQIPSDGYCVYNADDANVLRAIKSARCTCIPISLEHEALYQATELVQHENACYDFSFVREGESLSRVALHVPGRHNVYNALASMAALHIAGLCAQEISDGISQYQGTQRRFQYMGEFFGCQLYQDYAHHPTEIRATLQVARKISTGRLWSVFQPHTYSRTRALFTEFVQSFQGSDASVFVPIYAAREPDPGDMSSQMLCEAIEAAYHPAFCYSASDFADAREYILQHIQPGDTLFILGAGDVEYMCPMMLEGR